MVSGRMMMIRACLSLLIATLVKDLVPPQVSGTPSECVDPRADIVYGIIALKSAGLGLMRWSCRQVGLAFGRIDQEDHFTYIRLIAST